MRDTKTRRPGRSQARTRTDGQERFPAGCLVERTGEDYWGEALRSYRIAGLGWYTDVRWPSGVETSEPTSELSK